MIAQVQGSFGWQFLVFPGKVAPALLSPISQFNPEYLSHHEEETKTHHQNSGNLRDQALISGLADSNTYASHD
jgi:hypothetical protein